MSVAMCVLCVSMIVTTIQEMVDGMVWLVIRGEYFSEHKE